MMQNFIKRKKTGPQSRRERRRAKGEIDYIHKIIIPDLNEFLRQLFDEHDEISYNDLYLRYLVHFSNITERLNDRFTYIELMPIWFAFLFKPQEDEES